ncbi:MAG: hypothetical protein AB7I18_03870 [Candidatus Berkiella sp.]
MSLSGSHDLTFDLFDGLALEDDNWHSWYQESNFLFDTLQFIKQEPLSNELEEELLPEPAIVDSPKKPQKASSKKHNETFQERKDTIAALKKEIVGLKEKQNNINIADPKQQRLRKNRVAAAISRRTKQLVLLEKDQRISDLKADRKALKLENAELQSKLQQLTAELAQYKKPISEMNFELSVALPQTSMLIRYQSPASSPQKPPVANAMKSQSLAKTTLRF